MRSAWHTGATLAGLGLWLCAAHAHAQDGAVRPPAASTPQAPAQQPPAAAAATPQPTTAGASATPAGTPQPTTAGASATPVGTPQPTTAGASATPAGTPQPAPADATAEPAEFSVVAVAPTPGAHTAEWRVPRNVQQLDAADLARAGSPRSLHGALQRQVAGVTVNDVAGNPLQPDLQYRGFTASPTLGTPQGIALYQNGVRLNEPFGDLVQWDLVPSFAIDHVQLLPGSSPLYGLNALGGSLVLSMKNGFRNPGYSAETLAGSFGRFETRGEYGQASGNVAAYVGASLFGETGFRDHSPSRALNLFGDLRRRGPRHELGLNVTLAGTELYGNGPTPEQLLAEDRSALYTYPDIARHDLVLVASDGSLDLSRTLTLQGTAYLRHAGGGTTSGDEADFQSCPTDDPDAEPTLCDETGAPVHDEAGDPVSAGATPDALVHTMDTNTLGYGGALQLLAHGALGTHRNQFLLGTSYDGSEVQFLQRAQLGALDDDRAVTPAGPYLGDDAYRTELEVRNHHVGLYAADTFDLARGLALNAAARLNWSAVQMRDPTGSALDGDHHFVRVNPSVGLSYQPWPVFGAFASYNEANRVPSAAELGCADPSAPCRLPNAFVSDPPLEQVVSRSIELGLRGRLGARRGRGTGSGAGLRWSVTGYGSRNTNDIVFVAGSRVGTGYFRNAGDTQRVGLELGLNAELGLLDASASYALLRATYESALELPGGAHPYATGAGADGEGGTIQVQPGDRIPGLPAHGLRAGVGVRPVKRLRLGLELLAQSAQYLRGDESNQLAPVDGFATLDAEASYEPLDGVQVLAQARNLLNARYETFGVVADPSTVLPGYTSPRFLTPGAPFGVWAGVRLTGL